ncbi:DNA gyrase subunit A [Candidatus Anstonella stagnisolia]|nr:DNA gyrase subunit A [Candidatus Anstonella stagnisolia]
MADTQKVEVENSQAKGAERKADVEYSHGKITERPVEAEMKTSYMDYAMSVIVGRALPDVRDGLKPVHKRILYAMYELSNTHDKPYKKSARIVGEVLGKYHPHGDVAIYDSLVRMAQEFSMRCPLVDGQGNFGSMDGDNAAAMRYTEVRMSRIAEEMLTDIEKNTVDFAPNFDATLKEPLVLPSAIPNLLVNGSSGIAVGMATNIPPHNLGEIIDALVLMIDTPSVTLEQLMDKVKGPDFPTGGIICGTVGIRSAYATGRGSVKVRGKCEIAQSKKDKARKKIVITELPYQVNKAELVKKIAELVRDKVLEGISDIADRSDRTGIEVEIELKRDANADVVLNQLYAHTALESTFGITNLALVNNEPKTMGLSDMLREFINHRRTVVRRRCDFDLAQAKERKHVLDAFKAALGKIDEVIKTLKAAPNSASAKEALVALLSIDVKQAEAILELKLGRLTALERDKIDAEHIELSKKIEWLVSVLSDEAKIFAIVREELLVIKKKYADARRTEIVAAADDDIGIEDLVPDEKAVVIITKSDYVKRVGLEEYRVQGRGGKGVVGTEMKEEDEVKDVLVCNTHDYLLCFTHDGTVHWLKVYKIPQTGRYAMGKAIVNLLNVKDGKLAAAIPVREFKEGENLVMCTKNGVVKRSALTDYSRPRQGGIIAITLKEKDELIEVRKTDGKRSIIIGTKNGYAIRFNEEDVREIGRTGQGVRGIDLRDSDEVVGMALDDVKTLLTVCENGYGKRTELEEYRLQGRGGMGVINIQADERNGKVVALRAVEDGDEIILLSNMGKAIRIPADGISVVGRNTKGVRLMRLQEKEKVVAIAIIKKQNGNGNSAPNVANAQPAPPAA